MKRILKRILLYPAVSAAAALAVWIGFLAKEAPPATILMYHSVGEAWPRGSALNISFRAFETQMSYLKRHHYRVVPLEEIVAALRSGTPIPRRTVAITFDDGYENNFTRAFPVLKKHGFPATIFLIVDHLGKEMEVYGHSIRFLDPEMVRAMSASGLVTFESHTMHHVLLDRVSDPSAMAEELVGSRRAIEALTGRLVTILCYPVGAYTPEVERMVRRAGYDAAVTTAPKKKGYLYRDIYALKRVKMTSDVSPVVMFLKMNGYYLLMREMRP